MEEKMMKIHELLLKVNDPVVQQFFDLDSEKLLDEKIDVLSALVSGKPPVEIPKYYDVLELYPHNEMWD